MYWEIEPLLLEVSVLVTIEPFPLMLLVLVRLASMVALLVKLPSLVTVFCVIFVLFVLLLWKFVVPLPVITTVFSPPLIFKVPALLKSEFKESASATETVPPVRIRLFEMEDPQLIV